MIERKNMGWKQDWVFLNLQIPKSMDLAMREITRKEGLSKADQTRHALMRQLGIKDLSADYLPLGGSAASNCKTATS